MMIPTILDAINSLGIQGDVIVVCNNNYEGIEWANEPTRTKEEVETELQRLKDEQSAYNYKQLRAAEYPDFRDYLDGIVKDDQAQIQDYIQKCLAVKAKYPKPS